MEMMHEMRRRASLSLEKLSVYRELGAFVLCMATIGIIFAACSLIGYSA
jgi:hypothetical protein